MNKRITRLTVLQTGKVLALLYGFLGVIMLPFMLIGVIADPKSFPILIMVILYPIIGFIGGILMAVFYNLAAKWVGGIEVSVDSVETII
jgi:hypothetical protein